jgi:hypothetical protein
MYTIKLVHINSIVAGDTIFHDGDTRTVAKNNIKHGGLLGKTLFGDSYKFGYTKVQLVVWKKWILA